MVPTTRSTRERPRHPTARTTATRSTPAHSRQGLFRHLLSRDSSARLFPARRVRPRRDPNSPLGKLTRVDFVLIGTTLVLAGVGLVMVYSATRTIFPLEPTYYLKRQAIYCGLGLVIMVVCMCLDYRRFEGWAYAIYGTVLLALLAVLAIGKSVTAASSGSTAQRWIPLGPVTVQPSEFGVLAVIVAIATYASRHEAELGPKRYLATVGIAAVPMLLTYKQPDLGTSLVMGFVLLGLLVFAGVRLRYLGVTALVVVVLFVGGLQAHLLHGYQLQRLTSFLHQSQDTSGANYELTLAKSAVGAGGVWGTGLFRGQLTNLLYVPEQYADFIFSAIGEQTGFVGCVVVLGLFATLAYRILQVMRRARESFGRLCSGGVLVFFVFSVFQNVGMNVGIMPITGIPLPFISYGGSALVASFAAVGIVASVARRDVR